MSRTKNEFCEIDILRLKCEELLSTYLLVLNHYNDKPRKVLSDLFAAIWTTYKSSEPNELSEEILIETCYVLQKFAAERLKKDGKIK